MVCTESLCFKVQLHGLDMCPSLLSCRYRDRHFKAKVMTRWGLVGMEVGEGLMEARGRWGGY